MRHWPQSSVLAGMTCGAIFLLGCGAGSGGPPPADDAFLSYFYAARDVAQLLLYPPPPMPTLPEMPKENRQADVARAYEELEQRQAAAEGLAPQDLERLAEAEKALVAETGRFWNELAQKHAKEPGFPADWPRLEAAFRLCRRLQPAQK